MKKLAVLCVLGLALASSCKKDAPINSTSIVQQINTIPITNGDFEQWTRSLLPIIWATNSCPMCTPPWETYMAQKDSQVVFHGKYSMKLIYNFTPNPPGCYPGKCTGSGQGQTWVENKFAIPTHPSSLQGYVKCNLYGIDTVSINIKLFKNSMAVDSGKWRNTVNIGNWNQINIPISQHATQVDSALILITGGKYSDTTQNSTTFWVDYFSFL